MKNVINIKNKKAGFLYELSDKQVAGIQLTGTEIKSIRQGKVSFTDSYCFFRDNELYIKNLHITEYSHGTYANHNPKRDKKLLMNRKELNKLGKKTREKGFTIIPVRLFINDRGLAKLEIALGRGKKQFDKREDIKKRDTQRDVQRKIKI